MTPGLRIHGHAEIGPPAQVAFQRGEQPGHGLGIMPDVRAGALATADALPAVEPARLANQWQVEVARIDVLANVRSRNQYGSVESYQVSCQSRVCRRRRSKFSATYWATITNSNHYLCRYVSGCVSWSEGLWPDEVANAIRNQVESTNCHLLSIASNVAGNQ